MGQFMIPGRVYEGAGALEEAMPWLAACGRHAFIVTGPHVEKSPMMDKLKEVLREGCITSFIFDGITGEPTDDMILEGVRQYRQSGCDFIIGIGGGSPLDSAKAIAAIATGGGVPADYLGKEIDMKLPTIIAIPTTAGTGSEATKFTVITDRKTDVKMLLFGTCLIPDAAIIDPAFTRDMPARVTAGTGLDALTHAVEAYTSKKAMALTDVFAESAVRRILKYLPDAYRKSDYTARCQMSLAAFEAGVCINNSSVTLVHGMSRPIGALFHVPHGISNAMLLGKCLQFALPGAKEKFARLGRICGICSADAPDEEAGQAFIKAVQEVVTICEVPAPAEYGISQEAFMQAIPKMAKDAVASGSPGNTRRIVTEDDCREIYKKVYAGA